MNSFQFKAFLIFFILISQVLCAQSGSTSSKQLHPLSFLTDPFSPGKYLQVSYTNPLGIKSIQDFHIDYKYAMPRGSIHAGFQVFGIKGYSQYHLEAGCALNINDDISTGVIISTDFMPSDAFGRHEICFGSSFFSNIQVSNQFRMDIHLNNLTSFWFDRFSELGGPGLSLIARISAVDNVSVISGLNYTRGFSPVFRAGVAIIANHSHTIITGLQTGPPGFWFGYSLVLGKMKFLITIQSGGIFGYEPGSSIKYFID